MHVDPKTLSAEESYKLMTGVVVPRPVAWVTSLSPSGGVNLATIRAIAETGVDEISVGALTHSARSLDVSLELT